MRSSLLIVNTEVEKQTYKQENTEDDTVVKQE